MAAPRLISFVSQKGGVGKTTLSMLVADALHRMGKKVLVVDTDPQRSAQKWEAKALPDFPAYPVPLEAIHGLSPQEFAQWLMKRAYDKDYVIIDTPPNLESRELKTALFASDTVVLPFTAHATSIDALEEVIPLIKQIEQQRGNPIDVRVLLNKVDLRRGSEKAIVANAEKICPWPVMKSQLKTLAAYADACNYRTSLYSLPGGQAARSALESVAQEVVR